MKRAKLTEGEEVCVVSTTRKVYCATQKVYCARANLRGDWRAFWQEERGPCWTWLSPEDEGVWWARGWDPQTAEALLAAHLLAAPRHPTHIPR